MGSALSGIATIGMGQWKASAEAQAATQDAQDEQRILTYNALVASDKGTLDAGKVRMGTSQLIARQKVGYAASGVASDSGTAASVQASTRGLGELDAQTTENNAARDVWGYRMAREQSKKNLQRKYDSLNREAIGSALSGAAGILGSGGLGGFG